MYIYLIIIFKTNCHLAAAMQVVFVSNVPGHALHFNQRQTTVQSVLRVVFTCAAGTYDLK